MSTATVNGLTIEYDVHGPDDGEPLLLVMGLGGQLIAWPIAFVEQLVAEGFRVIRFDNRDTGLSTHWPTPAPRARQQLMALLSRRFAKPDYFLSDMAADAAALLDHLGIASSHVCGMSMGGMIAQSMAIHFPAKVRSLTSIMSNTGDRKHGKVHRSLLRKAPKLLRNDGDRIANSVRMFRWISGPHFDAVESRELAEAALARCDDADGTARQILAVAAGPDRTPDLQRVQLPTLVIHGLLDPLVKPDGGVATATAVPGSRLVMFPDMAHDIPRARWNDIVAEIVQIAGAAGGGADDRVPVRVVSARTRPTLVALDVEGVLVPEIWIAVAERTGIEQLRRTTRDEPDYDVLMRGRLALLDQHGLTMSAIAEVIGGLRPLDGAVEFLDELRARYQVVLLSDTFAPFARPLMAKLNWPTIFCHDLDVVDDRIVGYRLRMDDQKRHAVLALQSCGYRLVAAGDSYNDTSMLAVADTGLLFRAPDNVKDEFPMFDAHETYESLATAIDAAATST